MSFAIPRKFESIDLEKSIQDSKWLLDLEDDWDGEGSPSYSEVTWQKATKFLRDFLESLYSTYDMDIGLPKIAAGPQGSIDLHWKNEKFELLINIPVDGLVAKFYGDDYHENVMEGSLNMLKINKGLCVWVDCAQV